MNFSSDDMEPTRILIVDDDEDFGQSTKEILSAENYPIELATNSDGAVACAIAFQPDIALIDVKLGSESGVDLITPLREAVPSIQCVLMTGYSAMDTVIEAMRLKAADYLQKPIDVSLLRATIARCAKIVRLQEQNAQARVDLVESNERFSRLANASYEAIIVHADGKVLETNEAFGTIFEWLDRDARGSDMAELWSNASQASLMEHLGGKDISSELSGKSIRINGRRSDGSTFPAEIRTRALPILGKVARVSSVRDLTSEIAAEDERSQMDAQLRQAQKMEAIGQLTAGIAHDFNNILQVILGHTNLLERYQRTKPDERVARSVAEIRFMSDRARGVIAQLLTIGRGGSSDSEPIHLPDEISSIVKLLQASLPSTLEVALNTSADIALVSIDAVQLHQVVINLCINARDALNGEPGRITISLSQKSIQSNCSSCGAAVSGEYVVLSIADTGFGIDPQLLEKIFDPFFTTKAPGGSGLGLAVTHGIVHNHAGHIVVNTGPSGTDFQLLFPPSPGQVMAIPQEDAHEIQPDGTCQGRILVIDDEPAITQYLGALLASVGYEVMTTNDPTQALADFKQNPTSLDLVITDQTMPVLTGENLALQMLAHRPELPIILCTGYSATINAEKVAKLGIRGFLAKPFDADELLHLMSDILEQVGLARSI